MEIKEFIKDLKKLKKMGIEEITFAIGENPPNDFCYYHIDLINNECTLDNSEYKFLL